MANSQKVANITIQEIVKYVLEREHSAHQGARTVNTTNSTAKHGLQRFHPKEESSDIQALIYIIVVLSFYSFAIVTMMVKYVKKERENARMDWYYEEFVQRDRFNITLDIAKERRRVQLERERADAALARRQSSAAGRAASFVSARTKQARQQMLNRFSTSRLFGAQNSDGSSVADIEASRRGNPVSSINSISPSASRHLSFTSHDRARPLAIRHTASADNVLACADHTAPRDIAATTVVTRQPINVHHIISTLQAPTADETRDTASEAGHGNALDVQGGFEGDQSTRSTYETCDDNTQAG